MEIGQGVLGNYALVPKNVPLVYYVCSVLDVCAEKKYLILLFCLKWALNLTLRYFLHFFIEKVLTKPFSEAHNIDIVGAKHIKSI